MKPFIRKKLPFILIAVQAVLILGLLFYIVPGRYRLYDIVLYDASENVPENPLIGYAPRAESEENCEETDLVFIMLPFSEWEPREGVFDIAGLEEKFHVEKYRAEGKHAVLRFVCDIPSGTAHSNVPEWLRSVSGGKAYDEASGKGFSPDYSNEAFLKAHREALEALASWCGRDSFVSYVEIGSVGQNGVWSAAAQSAADLMPSDEVLAQYREQYREAFAGDEDILLLENAGMGKADDTDPKTGAAAGSWNDVLGDSTLTSEWKKDILGSDPKKKTDSGRTDGSTDSSKKTASVFAGEGGDSSQDSLLWTKAPVAGGLDESIPMDILLMDNLSNTLDQVRGCHISFIGPDCPDRDQQQTNGSEMIRRNMGYCLYLSRLQTTVDFIDDELLLHFTFNNIGMAPMYRDWPVMMYIYDSRRNCIRTQTLDLKLSELLPDSEITVTGRVPYSDSLLDGYGVGIAILSPDGTQHITLAQKGVLPNNEGIHKVYKYKGRRKKAFSLF